MNTLIQILGAAIGATVYLFFIKDNVDLTNVTKWILAVFLVLIGQYASTYIYNRIHNQ